MVDQHSGRPAAAHTTTPVVTSSSLYEAAFSTLGRNPQAGIALARTSLFGNDIRNGLLVRLFAVEVPSERSYFLVYPPRVAGAPKVALFRQWLREEIARDKAGVRKVAATPEKRSRR